MELMQYGIQIIFRLLPNKLSTKWTSYVIYGILGRKILIIDERKLLGNSELFDGVLQSSLLQTTGISQVPSSAHVSSVYFVQVSHIWETVNHKAWDINHIPINISFGGD